MNSTSLIPPAGRTTGEPRTARAREAFVRGGQSPAGKDPSQGPEKVLGDKLPNGLRANTPILMNTTLEAVNPMLKRKSPPDPHPPEMPGSRPSRKRGGRVWGASQEGPREAAPCPALGGCSPAGPLAHSSIITADDAGQRVKRAPHFQHKTPPPLSGAGAHFTPVHGCARRAPLLQPVSLSIISAHSASASPGLPARARSTRSTANSLRQ